MSAAIRVALLAAAVAGGLVMAPGCSSTTTSPGGLLVVMGSDGTVSQATRLHVDITSSDGSKPYRNADYAIPAETTLPTTLGVETDGDSATAVSVNASLWAGTTLLDDREDQVIQIPTDRVVELDIVFSAMCTAHASYQDAGAASPCGAGQTCNPADGTCVSSTVNVSQLPAYSGGDAGTSRPDATVPDSGAADGATPDSGPGACSPATCAGGCCGTDGQCHTDETVTTCGTGGGSCTDCAAGQACTAGACVAKCTPANCATGCCDATGTCVTATTDTQCGTAGVVCGACTGTNTCVEGSCGCAKSSDCPTGTACDATTLKCTSSCAGNLVCQNSCCDGTTCQQVDATRCMGTTQQTCENPGNWNNDPIVNGTCGAQCTPGTPSCSGQQPESCDANGMLHANGAACSTNACVNGQCSGVCVPGAQQCCEDPSPCNNGGSVTCSGGENNGGGCSNGSVPLIYPQICNSMGVWASQADCPNVQTPLNIEASCGVMNGVATCGKPFTGNAVP